MLYPIVIHKDENSDFGVTVPDLLGCTSAGSTLSEALSQAVVAIEGHLEILAEENRRIPQPKTIQEHMASGAYNDAFLWRSVEIDFFTTDRTCQSA